jgi:hypothetical protein
MWSDNDEKNLVHQRRTQFLWTKDGASRDGRDHRPPLLLTRLSGDAYASTIDGIGLPRNRLTPGLSHDQHETVMATAGRDVVATCCLLPG